MSRFQSLLQREWMQHHRGWLVQMLAPPLLILLLGLMTHTVQVEPNTPLPMFVALTGVVSLLVLGITWATVFIQAPGLARRDVQDRSIEFWRSLPTGHAASLGATLLMHALAMPLLALTIGYAFSQLIGMLIVTRVHGLGTLFALPWASLGAGSLATFARGVFGVLLASLWLMPLLLLLMACSAWLKRWGVPALALVLGVGHLVLSKVYDIRWIGDGLRALLSGARRSLLYAAPPDWKSLFETGVDAWPVTPLWLAQDALAALAALAQPAFVLGVALSAACFGLLVLKRRRGR